MTVPDAAPATPATSATPAAPVVVEPIQPHQSRTLRTARWTTIGTIAAAILPTIVSVILDLIGNPVIANLIANKVPVEYRVGIAIVFTIIIQRFGYLRKVTTAPIAGTEAAREALPAINLRSYVAPAPTDAGGTKP